MKKVLFIYISLFLSLGAVKAQNVIQVQPLFEYPVAPESMESLEDRCNYLVKVFWDNFNFKTKEAVDQYALNGAFQVYVTAFQFASAKEVEQSVDKLIKNLSGSPILLMQFGKAAEENLYGPRAEFWSDELYLKFAEAIIKNKKISDKRKTKYLTQESALSKSAIGNVAPSFWFEDKERASKQYFPMSTPTLLIFGNPDDTDWRLARLKMDTNFKFTKALDKGKINVLYIIPYDVDNWQQLVSNYNNHWTVGQSIDVPGKYDTRLNPSIFIVGADGKIAQKNLQAEEAMVAILELVN